MTRGILEIHLRCYSARSPLLLVTLFIIENREVHAQPESIGICEMEDEVSDNPVDGEAQSLLSAILLSLVSHSLLVFSHIL